MSPPATFLRPVLVRFVRPFSPEPLKCGQECLRHLASSSRCPASRSEAQSGRPLGQMWPAAVWFGLPTTFKNQR